MKPDHETTQTPVPGEPANTEARVGDRGAASGRNIEQDRAIGQDDPQAGSSRMGGEKGKDSTIGTPDIGTDAGQTAEAERSKP